MAKEISIFLVLLVVGMVAFGAIGFFAIGQDGFTLDSLAGYDIKHMGVGERKITVWLADTPEKQTRGLMGITHLADNTGMLFVFGDALQQVFWNKDTLIDLDILWIRNARVVGISHLPKQSGEDIAYVASQGVVDMVLEVPAGWAERNNISESSAIDIQ